jgi:hypothetical protein
MKHRGANYRRPINGAVRIIKDVDDSTQDIAISYDRANRLIGAGLLRKVNVADYRNVYMFKEPEQWHKFLEESVSGSAQSTISV